MKAIQKVPGKQTLGSEILNSLNASSIAVRQRTLNGSISCNGVGLHSGAEISLRILPAEENSGIIFKRSDLSNSIIPGNWKYVVDTQMCTVLGNSNGDKVGTVEHLMAAFAGCGVDNATVEINGPEVPIMDGSSACFVEMIRDSGVVELDEARRVLRVLKEIEVSDQGRKVSLKPSNRPEFGIQIVYGDHIVSHQSISLEVVNGSFCKELAEARTFGFLQEVEALRAAGLALGGSLDNSIVVDTEKGRILNDGGLRQKDEFVRHKVLDAVGDLYLSGGQIIGKFEGYCSGHNLNNRLLQALFSDKKAWIWDVPSDREATFAVDGGIVALNSSTT
ncbi:MAG: UDP-3-O-acyl-N-acetylglucosamine deacetylase [Alphaproteobacteria bacterium MarineAlpha3_Bin5]|nr:MAG: UDP-3-O-acyl-N-acetylglucosamine deacetylase [Alphaproteobacteria bacterium MarineAlpha3_Bin5]